MTFPFAAFLVFKVAKIHFPCKDRNIQINKMDILLTRRDTVCETLSKREADPLACSGAMVCVRNS